MGHSGEDEGVLEERAGRATLEQRWNSCNDVYVISPERTMAEASTSSLPDQELGTVSLIPTYVSQQHHTRLMCLLIQQMS